MVDGVELLRVPAVVDDSGLGIIRDEYTGYSAKILIHVYMGRYPCLLLFVDEGFDIWIHTVAHDSYEQPCIDDLSGIRIDYVSRVACPVYLDLFSGIARHMHRSASLLFILLDVVAEL